MRGLTFACSQFGRSEVRCEFEENGELAIRRWVEGKRFVKAVSSA